MSSLSSRSSQLVVVLGLLVASIVVLGGASDAASGPMTAGGGCTGTWAADLSVYSAGAGSFDSDCATASVDIYNIGWGLEASSFDNSGWLLATASDGGGYRSYHILCPHNGVCDVVYQTKDA